jgi:hypothetical protein
MAMAGSIGEINQNGGGGGVAYLAATAAAKYLAKAICGESININGGKRNINGSVGVYGSAKYRRRNESGMSSMAKAVIGGENRHRKHENSSAAAEAVKAKEKRGERVSAAAAASQPPAAYLQ